MRLPGLSMAQRPALFEAIRALPAACEPYLAADFAGRAGWVVSQLGPAVSLLTSGAGVKSRPEHSQLRLGGVGALRGGQVGAVKRLLVDAVGVEARRADLMRRHLAAELPGGPVPGPGAVTEALAAALTAQLTGQRPGGVDGGELRLLVERAWTVLEDRGPAARRASAPEPGGSDGLAAYLRELCESGARSGDEQSLFLDRLRVAGWSVECIAVELRAMILAAWGSTTAAVLSATSLGVGALPSRGEVDEVLRLYPPSFMIARTIVEPAGAAVPFAVGDLVLISPWLIHRHPRGWPDALRFGPGRWARREGAAWFLPFGVGARRCPAAQFARAQITAAVGHPAFGGLSGAGAQIGLVESRSPALVPQNFARGGPSRVACRHW